MRPARRHTPSLLLVPTVKGKRAFEFSIDSKSKFLMARIHFFCQQDDWYPTIAAIVEQLVVKFDNDEVLGGRKPARSKSAHDH